MIEPLKYLKNLLKKVKKIKRKRLLIPGEAEAGAVVAAVGRAAVTIRRPAVTGIEVPAAATYNTAGA